MSEQLPDPALEAQVGLERMIGFGASHRREHVDLLHVGVGQGAERSGGADAAVDIPAVADAGRLVPARDRAGGDHGVGQRCAGGAEVAEPHPLPGVVVHGHDPGAAVGPGPRVFRMTLLQRADQRPERHVPPAAVRQPAARPHPGRYLEEQRRARQRQRARAQLRPRRQRPVLRGEHHGFAQRAAGVPALPGHDLVQRRTAAQRGGQHAARARADEEIDVGGGEPLVQADQRAGHPGRAEHAARAQHQGGPGTAAAYHPIRTKDHSRHICLRNLPAPGDGVT